VKRGTFRKKTYQEALLARRDVLLERSYKAYKALGRTKANKTVKGKGKKLTASKLKKKLDAIFSQYIRQKYADEKGYAQCYTCPTKKHWKEMQCGHFVSRSQMATRFSEDNCRVQCIGCNVFGGGRVTIFANNLEREIAGIVTNLYRKAQEITKDFPYAEKIEEYTKKLAELSTQTH
jgi:hypothetical protein